MLHDALYDRLKTITAKVYPGMAPEAVTLPYIVFFQVSNIPSPNASGASTLDDIRYQVSVFARTYREMEIMAELVRDALDEYREIPQLDIKHGRLYNWHSIAGLAPTGWHVATDPEYTALAAELGGTTVAGGKMKASEYWNAPNTGADNESGFTAYGSGNRNNNGSFASLLNTAIFWSSTLSLPASGAFFWYLNTNNAAISRIGYDKAGGNSIRLIRDDATGWTEGEQLTDGDGNIYDTVQIGDQIWTVQNYACTKLADGTPIAKVTDSTAWAALTTGAYCDYDNDDSNVFVVNELTIERSSFAGENYIPEGTGVHHKAIDFKITVKR